MTRGRSAFAAPLVHAPPGVVQPWRLLAVQVLRAVACAAPASWLAPGGQLFSLASRLELAELWRTDVLTWRIVKGRQSGARIGTGCRLYSFRVVSEAELVEIGDDVIISGDVTFVTHDGAIFTRPDLFPQVNGHYGRIRIGARCFLGFGAMVMPGVELGDGCVVAAGAVVMDSFAPNSVVAGNPAAYVCPTSMYLAMRRGSPNTIRDAAHPFPAKMPPSLLGEAMAGVPFRPLRKRSPGVLPISAGASRATPANPLPATPAPATPPARSATVAAVDS